MHDICVTVSGFKCRAIYSTKLTGFQPQKSQDPGGAGRRAQRCGGGCGRLAAVRCEDGSLSNSAQRSSKWSNHSTQWMPMVSKWNEVPRRPRTRHVYFQKCRWCERVVTLDENDFIEVLEGLRH